MGVLSQSSLAWPAQGGSSWRRRFGLMMRSSGLRLSVADASAAVRLTWSAAGQTSLSYNNIKAVLT